MSEPTDSDSEMPTFPFPWTTRPDGRTFDALLAGTCQPEEAPAELRAVAEVFAVLRAPSDRREVAGWDQALIAYRGIAGPPQVPSRSRSRRRQRAPAPLRTRLAAAAGVAVVAVLSGGVAAAYTGHLPSTLQRAAHVIGAPDVRHTRAVPTPTPTPGASVHPVGPSATGSAVYGLCRAYQRAGEHGKAAQNSVAFHNLITAAGGTDRVAAYCAKIPHPGPARPSASLPGRRVGQSGSPGHSNHHPRNRPTPTPTPTKTKKQHGNGNGNGNQSP